MKWRARVKQEIVDALNPDSDWGVNVETLQQNVPAIAQWKGLAVMRFLSSMEKEGSVYLGYQYAADAPTAPATARVMLQFLKDDGGVLDRRELWRLCRSNRDIQGFRPSTWLHHLQGLVRRKAVNMFFYPSEDDEEEEAAAAAGV